MTLNCQLSIDPCVPRGPRAAGRGCRVLGVSPELGWIRRCGDTGSWRGLSCVIAGGSWLFHESLCARENIFRTKAAKLLSSVLTRSVGHECMRMSVSGVLPGLERGHEPPECGSVL